MFFFSQLFSFLDLTDDAFHRSAYAKITQQSNIATYTEAVRRQGVLLVSSILVSDH